jgi:hypothetical protein
MPTDMSMTFMQAKPATASGASSGRAADCGGSSSSPRGWLAKPMAASASISSGASIVAACATRTCRAVRLTLAAETPGSPSKPRSTFAMHPAQCIPGTASTVSAKANGSLGSGAFMADPARCAMSWRLRSARSECANVQMEVNLSR